MSFAICCTSCSGRGANEETSTLQEPRSSKPGEEEGEKCKGGEDVSRGEDGESGRRSSMRKLSMTRRQSRDLLKKKTSFEEQVLLVTGTGTPVLVQYTGFGAHRGTAALEIIAGVLICGKINIAFLK